MTTPATSAEIRADRDRLADLLRQAAAIADHLAVSTTEQHYRQFAGLWRIQARLLTDPPPPADWRLWEHEDERNT